MAGVGEWVGLETAGLDAKLGVLEEQLQVLDKQAQMLQSSIDLIKAEPDYPEDHELKMAVLENLDVLKSNASKRETILQKMEDIKKEFADRYPCISSLVADAGAAADEGSAPLAPVAAPEQPSTTSSGPVLMDEPPTEGLLL